MKRIAPGCALLLALAAGAGAQPAPAPCAAAEHRQFDFWIGEWTVTQADGKTAGRNRVEKSLDGCVLHERWQSAGAHRGESFNLYDAARKVWHQSWVDNSGLLLSLEGGRRGESMVLEGERPGREGGTARHRITWTPRPDGTVRQHWEVSADGGRTWKTVFDGKYARAP